MYWKQFYHFILQKMCRRGCFCPLISGTLNIFLCFLLKCKGLVLCLLGLQESLSHSLNQVPFCGHLPHGLDFYCHSKRLIMSKGYQWAWQQFPVIRSNLRCPANVTNWIPSLQWRVSLPPKPGVLLGLFKSVVLKFYPLVTEYFVKLFTFHALFCFYVSTLLLYHQHFVCWTFAVSFMYKF